MDYNIIKEGNILCTYVNTGRKMKMRETKEKGKHKLRSLCTTAILLLQYPAPRHPKPPPRMKE